MSIIFLLGRLLYGGYFLTASFSHLFKTSSMAPYAAMKKVPAPKVAIFVSGLLILLGSLGIILGIHVTTAALLLSIFLIPVSFKMHDYWTVPDPQMKGMQKILFWKNMALLGAAWMFPMISHWPYSLMNLMK